MMPRVTSLVLQKRNHDRVNVFLDGDFAFGIAAILASTLKRGQELSQADISELRERDAVETAYEKCLNYLSYRPRSRQEIKRYLTKKEYPDSVIDQVTERLEHHHLIDDNEFARIWVENRESFRPRGRYALCYELRQKGIAPDAIDAALSDLDEEASALRAAERRAERFVDLDKAIYYKRLLGFLQRRGFGYGVSRKVVDHYWFQLHSDEGINPG